MLGPDVRQVQIIPGRATEQIRAAHRARSRRTGEANVFAGNSAARVSTCFTQGLVGQSSEAQNHQGDKNLCWDSSRMLQPARRFMIASALLPTALAICLPTRDDALHVGVLESGL